MSKRALFLPATAIAALAFAGPTAGHATPSIEGAWDTPYGRIQVEKKDDGYLGTLSESARACAFPPGTPVLRGHLEEGLFTGEMRVCYGPRCSGDPWVLALAVALAAPERLVGSLGMPEQGCSFGGPGTQAFTFVRPRASPRDPPSPQPPAPRAAKSAIKPAARPFFEQGFDLATRGEFEKAQRKLKQAEEIDPSNPEILNQLGVTFSARQSWSTARSYFQRAVRADPTFAAAQYNLARALAREGNPTEGLRALRAAVDTGYGDPAAIDSDPDLAPIRALPSYEAVRKAAEKNSLSSP